MVAGQIRQTFLSKCDVPLQAWEVQHDEAGFVLLDEKGEPQKTCFFDVDPEMGEQRPRPAVWVAHMYGPWGGALHLRP